MIGTQLGRFHVISALGSGGMGKVYLAEVTDPTAGPDAEDRVALKVVHPHLVEKEEFRKRFQREAEIGKAVKHPNVVRTFAADASLHEGSEVHFLVMEFVEGQTLRSLLEELGAVPEELCRHIGGEVARALVAIHEAGIVHRDLKPENVLITQNQVVKVMDLGVAQLTEETIRLSQRGSFAGSVNYAAPEQFDTGTTKVDGRADLHALGVMLYELATSEHPFAHPDFHIVLRRVLTERPRRLLELRPEISPFFSEMVATLLRKNREERFGSARELLRVLEEGERSGWWKEHARSIKPGIGRAARSIRIARDTRVHGRDSEIAKLRAFYENAKAGEGRIVLIEGEAGIGKTRLVDEFVRGLNSEDEDLSFLFGSFPPGGAATAAGAFVSAFRDHLGEAAVEALAVRSLTATPLLVPPFAALLRGDATPPGAEPLTKEAMQTVFIQAMRALAAERPTVLLIDDLNFAPEEGRALFAALALAVPGHKLVLVGAARPGLPADWRSDIERLDHAAHLSVPRLTPPDVVRLLGEALHSEPLAEELAPEIGLRSDGNPLFVFEILRGLKKEEFITRQDDGSWARTRRVHEIKIPSSVMDLIRARIDDLEDEDRTLLDVASCYGFEFDPVLVAESLGLSVLAALKQFDRIEKRHRLVHSQGRQYLFDHHQVQEALYLGLFAQLRERYHLSLAEALERREHAQDKDPMLLDGAVVVRLCEHHQLGGSGKRALRFLDAALLHLETGYLHARAADLLDRALLEEGLLQGRERLERLLRKAALLDLLGRRAEELGTLEEALALGDSIGDLGLRARVRRSMGVHLLNVGRHEEARQILLEARSLARESLEREEEGLATGALGNVLFSLARYDEARDHYEHHLSLSRELGDLRGQASAANNLGNVLYQLGRIEEARVHHERCLALAREIGDPRMEAIATGNLGTDFFYLGRHEEARIHHERYLGLSREVGGRRSEAIASGNLGLALMALGRCEEGCSQFERYLSLSREMGDRQGEAAALVNLGQIFSVLGASGQARESIEKSRLLGAAIGARQVEGYALMVLGMVEEQEGNLSQAEERYREALVLHDQIGYRVGRAETLVGLGALLARQGRVEEARTFLADALASAREVNTPNEETLAAIYAASLPGGDPRMDLEIFQANEPRLSHREKMMAHFLLWKRTAELGHLSGAQHLLVALRDQAPARYRESLIENVPIHREIQAAWKVCGPGNVLRSPFAT